MSTQHRSGLRSVSRSLAAVLRTLLPPTTQRGVKSHPVGSNAPEGYPSPINKLVIGRASPIG